LKFLAAVNQLLGLYTEGIQQAEESLGIFKQLSHTLGQADSLQQLAWLLYKDDQLDAAEEAVSQSVNLLLGEGEQFTVCQGYSLLGEICHSKGETEKAITQFKAALGIAVSLDWPTRQIWILISLARLFLKEDRFSDAEAHIEYAKLRTTNDRYLLGHVVLLQANLWYQQCRFKAARSEALDAADIFEKLGAVRDVEDCRQLLQEIEEDVGKQVTSEEIHSKGELLKVVPFSTLTNSPFLVQNAEVTVYFQTYLSITPTSGPLPSIVLFIIAITSYPPLTYILPCSIPNLLHYIHFVFYF
jgi:tetratricopeptide (TPR) repeat protein